MEGVYISVQVRPYICLRSLDQLCLMIASLIEYSPRQNHMVNFCPMMQLWQYSELTPVHFLLVTDREVIVDV